ncbi:hypothetical protein [uncultured Halomonas sp.]|mgnify:FL=1|uniref:hypothetical protein n=1 Tax=uncultured Halomonas sp. TaxID=173971 RepID=UPI0026080C27|nr:hypothetical protein [uncultured Halomonas sp.]
MAAGTTELEAINIMLSTIGESPVNSLAELSSVVDAVVAKSVLKEVSTAVQEEGWHFNIEKNFTLTPDFVNKEIQVPGNCIQCDATGQDSHRDVCVRGNRLYDRDNHTFIFDRPVQVDMVLVMDFEELPQAARHYITIRAARVYQQRVVGSETLGSFTEKDEARARAGLRKFEADTADYNILKGNWSVMRILDR